MIYVRKYTLKINIRKLICIGKYCEDCIFYISIFWITFYNINIHWAPLFQTALNEVLKKRQLPPSPKIFKIKVVQSLEMLKLWLLANGIGIRYLLHIWYPKKSSNQHIQHQNFFDLVKCFEPLSNTHTGSFPLYEFLKAICINIYIFSIYFVFLVLSNFFGLNLIFFARTNSR